MLKIYLLMFDGGLSWDYACQIRIRTIFSDPLYSSTCKCEPISSYRRWRRHRQTNLCNPLSRKPCSIDELLVQWEILPQKIIWLEIAEAMVCRPLVSMHIYTLKIHESAHTTPPHTIYFYPLYQIMHHRTYLIWYCFIS